MSNNASTRNNKNNYTHKAVPTNKSKRKRQQAKHRRLRRKLRIYNSICYAMWLFLLLLVRTQLRWYHLAFNWWWWVFVMTSNQAGGNSCWNSCNIERSAARWRSLYTCRSTRHLSTLKRILPVDFVGENFCLFVMKPYLAGCLTDWRIVWLIGDWWLGAVLSSGLVGSLACCVGGATLQWDP